jgi:cyanate permease
MVLGLSTAIGTFAGALGPGLIGLIRDATGDYGAALLLCMASEDRGRRLRAIRRR